MNFSEGNGKLLLTSVVGVLGLGSLAYFLASDSAGNGEELLPALTLKETQDILSKILERVKVLSVRYARASQQIQQQVAQQGQQMSELEINKHFILPHFETGFQEAEEAVLEDFDCDSDELEEAGRYYADVEKDDIVMELLRKLKSLHKTFGGESNMNEFTGGAGGVSTSVAPSGGQDMTLSLVLEVLNKLSAMVGDATDEYCQNFIGSFGLPQSQELMQQFQGGMLQMSETMEAQVLQAYGLSQEDFQKGIMSHQADPSLHEAIQSMQIKNQQRLQSHGIAMQ